MLLPRKPFLILLVLAILAPACSPSLPAATFPSSPPIDPAFGAFWQEYGGLASFGPPLRPARQDGALRRQTFLNVELVFAPSDGEVSLAPLGWRLGLAEPPVPPSTNAGLYFDSTGHSLYPGFAQAYARLGGESLVGPPISDVRFQNGRFSQFFGNLGLYREEIAPPTEVHLFALGYAALTRHEDLQVRDFRLVIPEEVHSRPFGGFLDLFGGESLFGRPLSEPYLSADGAVEQIYERAVLYWQPVFGDQVRLRPLGREAGPAEPAARRADESDALYFPQSGHNVRWALAQFYRAFEGERLFGFPLEEAHLDGETLVQRFENAVLVYRYDLPAHLAVQLAPLGIPYFERHALPEPSPTPRPPTPTAPPPSPGIAAVVLIQAWVERPVLPAGQPQRIFLRISFADGSPWVGAMPILAVHGPRSTSYPEVPRTGVDGLSQVVVEMPDLQPGEIVNYEVAVAGEEGIGYAIDQFAGGPREP